MLGTALFLTAIVALLAGVLLDGAAAFSRAGVHAAAEHAAEGAARDAVAAYQVKLEDAITADPANAQLHPPSLFTGTPPPVAVLQNSASPPSASTATVAAAATPGPGSDSAFTFVYAVTPSTVSAPSCAQNAGGSSADTIAWLQCDGHIQESRMSLNVTVQAYDPGGSLIAQRQTFVTLRLFDEPPYSAMTGRLDGTASDPLANGGALAHEGDSGGDTISGAAAPQPSPYPQGGTLFHVRYACTDGEGSCSNAAPPDPDAAHLQSDAKWQNGNTASP